MNGNKPIEQRLPWLCRLGFHRWKPGHTLGVVEFNRASVRAWVYDGDVCQRCYRVEYRLGEWAKERDQRYALLTRKADAA